MSEQGGKGILGVDHSGGPCRLLYRGERRLRERTSVSTDRDRLVAFCENMASVERDLEFRETYRAIAASLRRLADAEKRASEAERERDAFRNTLAEFGRAIGGPT